MEPEVSKWKLRETAAHKYRVAMLIATVALLFYSVIFY